MGKHNRKPSESLYAFIEQAARMLRKAASPLSAKKEKFSKKDGVSNVNKIEQIALLLRSQVKKVRRRKKRKD